MARLLYADPGSHLVYQLAGRSVRSAAGMVATLYSDAAGTTLADIAAYDPLTPNTPGAVIGSSQLTVNSDSLLPWFWGPASGLDTLYVTVNGGPLTSINAYYDPRIDALEAGSMPAFVVEPGDDVQAAIDAANAAGGGLVWLQPGTHTHTGLTMLDHVIVDGVSAESTSLVLAPGSDVSCITTDGFATLTGTGANGLNNSGPQGWAIRNVEIVGDQANQSGTSWGLQAYGFNYTLSGVRIRDCRTGGMYTEWGDFGLSDPVANGMESRFDDLKIHHNGGTGWHHRGPHDTVASSIQLWENTGFGLWAQSSDGVYSANGTILVGIHTYGSVHTWGVVADAQLHGVGCQTEGASVGQLWIRYGDCTWYGHVYDIAVGGGTGIGLRLGETGVSTATGLHFSGPITGFKGAGAATRAIDVQQSAACNIDARVYLATNGTALGGTFAADDTVMLTVAGAGMSSASGASQSLVQVRGRTVIAGPSASQAWVLSAGGVDRINVNTSSSPPRYELLGGMRLRFFSDDFYSTERLRFDGATGHIEVTSTTVPGAVPGGALGTGAPAILVDAVSNDMRGLLGFGTGNNAFPGNAITVTFAQPFSTNNIQVVLQARNAATAALRPFPSSLSGNGFSVELENDPADNQPAGTYYVTYLVLG